LSEHFGASVFGVKRSQPNCPQSDFSDGDDFEKRLRDIDWTSTSLGEQRSWPAALSTMVRTILANDIPSIVCWGPDHILFYNDAAAEIVRALQIGELGSPAFAAPKTIAARHLAKSVSDILKSAKTAASQEIIIETETNGAAEESHFHVSQFRIPAEDGSGTAGVLMTFHETTQKVVEKREMESAHISLHGRLNEMRSVYSLSQAVGRAATMQEIYEAALDALVGVLGADRASILLFDRSGVMRFKAWRGLTEEYRQAVEGHSPWSIHESDPKAFGIEDVATDESLGALKQTILSQGIRALGFIPLMYEGRLLGKVMVYFDRPRHYAQEEWEIIQTIANQIAFAIARRSANITIEQAHERLRLALAAGSMGTWTRELTGPDKVEWSPELEAIFGLSPGEFGGTEEAFLQYVHPDDRALISTAVQNAIENHTDYEIEFRFTPKNGGVRWMIGRGRATYNSSGVPIRLAGVGIDVTARRRAEEAFRFLAAASRELSAPIDSENTLRKVANVAVPLFADWCSVYLVTPDLRIQRVASAHVDPEKQPLLDQLEEEKFPLTWESPATVVQAMKEQRSVFIERVLPSHYEEWRGHYGEEFKKLATELRLASIISVPLFARGRAFGAIRLGVSEPRECYTAADVAIAEDLGRRMSAALETAQLYWEVKEADQRKDEFLAMLSHELRNPLAPISNAVRLMELKPRDETTLARSAEIINRQVRQLTRLVEDLLDVSRITSGKITLQHDQVDFSALVARAVETARPLVESRKQTVKISLPEHPIYLHADPARVEQILTNLLNNASKYSEEGGAISLSARTAGNQVELRVKDNGIGIMPEMLSRIFELFTQAERSLDRSQGGLGIGLTLVKRLVELHGGTIDARSDGLGKGSEFIVRLPLAVQVLNKTSEAKSAIADTGVSKRVLIVDDNKDSAESAAMLIKHWGHTVRVANDGPSALKIAESFQPEVALLDIGLPGIDGYEVAKLIREMPGLENTLLIAITGYGQSQDRARSKAAGFGRHFVKPVDPAQLQSILSSASA